MTINIQPMGSTSEFLKYFELSNGVYFDVVHFTGQNIGFSVQRCYPDGGRFKPARDQSGKHDSVALLQVEYQFPTEAAPSNASVTVRIGRTSRYLHTHPGYFFNDPICPTEASLRESRKSVLPAEISATYLFDQTQSSFMTAKGKKLSGREILEEVFQRHCDTFHFLRGEPQQSLWWAKTKMDALCVRGIMLINWALVKFFDREISPDDGATNDIFFAHLSIEKEKEKELKRIEKDTLTFANYKTSKNMVALVCLLMILGFALYWWHKGTHPDLAQFLKQFFSNPILSGCAVFLLFFFVDTLLPKWLFDFRNALIRLRLWCI